MSKPEVPDIFVFQLQIVKIPKFGTSVKYSLEVGIWA